MKYCISDRYVRQFLNISINGFSFPRRDTSVRGAQPADVGSVAALGGIRITGGGRSLVRDRRTVGPRASLGRI